MVIARHLAPDASLNTLAALRLPNPKEEYLRPRLLERCLDLRAPGRVLCNRDSVAYPMFAGHFMAGDVLVCASLCSKDHDRSPARSSGDFFVNLGAGGNNTADHRIALRNIVADLFVPGECAANKGDSGVRNIQQIAPYSVLTQNE